MEITCLLENNTTDPQLAAAHGLSFLSAQAPGPFFLIWDRTKNLQTMQNIWVWTCQKRT